jgi:adenylate cyclase
MPVTLEFARQMFARAIVIDPTYARAFAGVSDCCSYLYMYFDASQDNLREAISASRKAVELDPESAEAHTSRGLAASLSKNYEEAEKEFESALGLNPNYLKLTTSTVDLASLRRNIKRRPTSLKKPER